ncbi:MAG TPA: hypothetical protein VG733_11415 [Chthoniobacteraceae bacterium]|nr:hypothetical protein [Chthoniobacteraceae bacterium]
MAIELTPIIQTLRKPIKISFGFYVASWFITLALPFLVAAFWPVAGAMLGVVLAVLWIALMPGTCMSGVFISFPMSMIQLMVGVGWLLLFFKALHHR